MASVVMHGQADVESVEAMRCICAALVGCLVDDNLGAGWGDGASVEVKVSVEAGICREFRMSMGRS